MTQIKITSFLAVILLITSTSLLAKDPAIKAAAKATNKIFLTTSYLAKVNIRRYGHHYVLPNGQPAPKKGKKQGRGGERAIQFDDGVRVRAGEIGESIMVIPKKKEIWVGLNRTRGKPMNSDTVHVLFNRKVVADDLTPEKIARAVISVAEIKGFEAGKDVAAVFDEVLTAAPEVKQRTVTPSRSTRPTVASLKVWSEPEVAKPGAAVELILEYLIQAPVGKAEAVETRKLTFNGTTLPTYPIVDRLIREDGLFTSKYRQPLPLGAQPGTYTFEGEVCITKDCIHRTVTFRIARP